MAVYKMLTSPDKSRFMRMPHTMQRGPITGVDVKIIQTVEK